MISHSVHVGPKGTVRIVLANDRSRRPGWGSSSLEGSGLQGSAGVHDDTVRDALGAPGHGEDLDTLRTCAELGALAKPREDAPPPMPELSHAAELRPGDIFRGYVIAGLFAEGGTALLYEATHATSLKRCLIKLLKPSYRGPAYAVMQKKLLAEGKFLMAAAGRNPYLVPCHDVGVDDQLGPFLIMDKLEGQTLAQHITKQRAGGKTFDPMTVVNLGRSLCVGLQMAHEVGAIHRDLKPANILVLTHRGGALQVILLDWGAAKSTFSPDTRHAPVFGTLAFMSPEQIDRGPISGATDEYALAIVLTELLWRHPFLSETGLTEAQLLMRMRFAPPDKPPGTFVPKKLWAILERSLAKSPDQRFGSCEALGAALAAWAQHPDKVEESVRASAKVRPTAPLLGFARDRAPTPAPSPTELVDPAPRLRLDELSEHASLLVRSGRHAGARFVLDPAPNQGRVVLGRHPAVAHVVLTDDKITQRHAALECIIQTPSKPMWSLIDLGSLNGTSVAGVRLSSGPEFDAIAPDCVTIRAGDTFVLGDVELALAPAGGLGEGGTWETYDPSAPAPTRTQAASASPHPTPATPATPAPGASPGAPPAFKRARPVMRLALGERFLAPTLLVESLDGVARYHLERETVLGSSPDRANLVITNDYISRAHVRFTLISGRFGGALTVVADDLGSVNGLYVPAPRPASPPAGGARGPASGPVSGKESRPGTVLEKRDSVVLHPGDTITLGKIDDPASQNLDAFIVTLLAPGHFDADAQEFVACDEHGRPLPTAEPDEAPGAEPAGALSRAPFRDLDRRELRPGGAFKLGFNQLALAVCVLLGLAAVVLLVLLVLQRSRP